MPNFYNELTSIMDISGIIYSEKDRLNQKSVGIQRAIDSQNRMIVLNQSYATRMREYSYMIMIIALMIVILIFLMAFQNLLPSVLYTFLFMLVSIGGIIWACVIYIGILNRDNVDFDKVVSIPPENAKDASGNILATSIDAGKISDVLKWNTFDACIGNDCCSSGTIYNQASNQCIIPPTTPVVRSSFTSISQAFQNGELSSKIPDSRTSLIFSSYP